MATLPTGTVTFFLSDIEGSTRLLEALGEEYERLLARHHEIFRAAFERGAAIEAANEGDSFFAVFPRPAAAVEVAVAVQRALAEEPWPHASTVRVRMGLHTGEARLAGGTYVGLDVHRAARIMAAAHGGQILVSDATRALAERAVNGIHFRDLGEHRLRDLSNRERLFQIVADGLDPAFPPPRTLDAAPNTLPTQPSELIGRDVELPAVAEQLRSPGTRLLTLLGPGGIGKTRLALQAAADESLRFENGVYFVDLSAARSPDDVLQAIVEAVGVELSGRADLRDALADELAPRGLLLLLDNFEQVVEAAEEIAVLLERCPKLKVLVTSREALRIRREQIFPVEPLTLPAPRVFTAADVARSAAARLFVERAQQARPTFELSDENAGVVAEICARLDGLPLAIELAAARLKLLSAVELRDRLRSRLELLHGGARDLPVRHQTLRSTIEWSYELLDDDERSIFGLLSLFASARVEAVEQVAAGLERLAHVDVVDVLSSLVDKSLVRASEDGGEHRLSMLATIREYAAEQLRRDSEPDVAARRRHAEYFAEHAAVARGDVEQLAAEIGNLQAAWRFFAEQGEPARLSALLDALWPLYDARGWYHGAVAHTNELLEILSQAAPQPGRADEEITLRLTAARALLALRGYTEEVERLYREALAIAESDGAALTQLPVLRSLASFHLYRGEIGKTLEIGREVLELARQHGDPGLQVEADLILGPALAFSGDYRAGLDHLDRAIELFDPELHGRTPFRVGPNPGVAARAVSGLVHWIFGYPDTAVRRAGEALELGEKLGQPYSLAYAAFHVGLLELWRGRLEPAAEQAHYVLRIAEEHDYRVWKAVALVLQGVTTAGLGGAEEGLALTEHGASLYENLTTPPVFWSQILGLQAQAFALAGRPADALAPLDRAVDLVPEGSWESAARTFQRADALAALGDREKAEIWLRGALDEAVAAGARMTELQAATALARLGEASGRPDTANLRRVFDTFTEGFETPQLLAARAALDSAGPAFQGA